MTTTRVPTICQTLYWVLYIFLAIPHSPEESESLLSFYQLRLREAESLLSIPYTAGLWFSHDSDPVLASEPVPCSLHYAATAVDDSHEDIAYLGVLRCPTQS